jgi:hypothetical protein
MKFNLINNELGAAGSKHGEGRGVYRVWVENRGKETTGETEV